MFIRQYFLKDKCRCTADWALVESYRTASGPRQWVVAWLGKIDEAGSLGFQQAVGGAGMLDGAGKRVDSSMLLAQLMQFDETLCFRGARPIKCEVFLRHRIYALGAARIEIAV